VPRVGPTKRRDLIKYLRRLGFDGPYVGPDHQFMIRHDVRLRLPNPHEGDVSASLLLRILQQAGVDREEWEQL
jgi:hypothetical protein